MSEQSAPPPPPLQRPGDVTDATDAELAALLAGAVLPVVTSVLADDELESVRLVRGAPPREQDVWVELSAVGEAFRDLFDDPDWRQGGTDAPRDLAVVVDRLADHLEDWVCETRFAWGQHRRADRPTAT